MIDFEKKQLDVTLVTADAPAAQRFYGQMMGFEEFAENPLHGQGRQRLFSVGRHMLKINAYADTPLIEEGGTDKAIGMRLLSFILPDLDGVLERFKAAGLTYQRLSLPDSVPLKVAFARDPDGNDLELVGLKTEPGKEPRKFDPQLQIGLTVSDVERFKHFYGHVMVFPQEPDMKLPKSMNMVGDLRYGFVAGGTTIKFWSKGEGLPTHTGVPEERTGIRMITGTVKELDRVYDRLVSCGVPIIQPPSEIPDLGRNMCTADPDGNWIEFVERFE